MYYADVQKPFSKLIAAGWPDATKLIENTDYTVLAMSSEPVSAQLTAIESALAAELSNDPISALFKAVPEELKTIVSQFLGQISIVLFTFQTGLRDDKGIAIRSFAIAIEPTDHTAELAGLTINDYGIQLNFTALPFGLVWNPILYAITSFLGVTCGLQVGLGNPSIQLCLSDGTASTIDTILSSASSGTTLASLAANMGVSLPEAPVKLDLLLVRAELGDAPQFDCVLALDFGGNTLRWGAFTLLSLAFSFSCGRGATTFGAKVVAQIGGDQHIYELDAELSYSSTSGITLTGACPVIGCTLADLWNQLEGPLNVSSPAAMLDDIYLSGLSLTLVQEQSGKTRFTIHCGGSVTFDALGAPLWFAFTFIGESGGEIDVTMSLNALIFEMSHEKNTTVFSFKGPQSLPLQDLVAAAQINLLTRFATDLNLTLQAADLVIVKDPVTKTNHRLFAADLTFDAAVQSPVLKMITGSDTIGCTGATLYGANAEWTLDQINAVPHRAVQIGAPVPQGISATPVLKLGSVSALMPLTSSTTNNTTSDNAPTPNPYGGVASTGESWFKVHRQLGPVYVDRLGFALSSAQNSVGIVLMADASFNVGPLTVSLSGFDIAIPYPNIADLSVSLNGLNVAYDKPPLTISGGFLSTEDSSYIGDLTVKTETLLLSAIGEYAEVDGHTSLSAFAALTQPPLGGPIFCFVDGLAAGFGYNSALNMPSKASEVADFALVQVASGNLSPQNPFSIIQQCITPSVGQDWIAIGILFRSFEVVQSVALLTAGFGDKLQFTILGQSEISLPPASTERIAYAQVDILAQYVPSEGTLSVSGVLTPKSYVLSPDCHIQGGFLYMLESSGEFIISYGGYARAFDYAARGYPDVPRLGMSWRIDSHTNIVGQAYCALTPNAIMAGGALHASWDSGIFSAWFDVAIDFLIQWRPFHYIADFSMSLGVSFDLKIWFVHIHFTFHIGANLTIHGPPFGGHAHIDLDVISFDISFGADNPSPTPLLWDEFRAMLPGDPSADATNSALLSAKVTGGLIQDFTNSGNQDSKNADLPDWIVNGTHFAFTIQSSLPITQAASGDVSVIEPPVATKIGILPMAEHSASGTLEIVLTGPEGRTINASTNPDIRVERIDTKGPAALWGLAAPTDANAAPITMTTGFILSGDLQASDETLIVDVANLLDELVTVQAVSDRPARIHPFS